MIRVFWHPLWDSSCLLQAADSSISPFCFLLCFSGLPGVISETPDTACYRHTGQQLSWGMHFARIGEPPVSGRAMETHIPSLDPEATQLSAAAVSLSCSSPPKSPMANPTQASLYHCLALREVGGGQIERILGYFELWDGQFPLQVHAQL